MLVVGVGHIVDQAAEGVPLGLAEPVARLQFHPAPGSFAVRVFVPPLAGLLHGVPVVLFAQMPHQPLLDESEPETSHI